MEFKFFIFAYQQQSKYCFMKLLVVNLSFKNTCRFDFRKSLASLYINGAAGVGVGVERLWGITMTTDIFVECMTQQYIQEAI